MESNYYSRSARSPNNENLSRGEGTNQSRTQGMVYDESSNRNDYKDEYVKSYSYTGKPHPSVDPRYGYGNSQDYQIGTKRPNIFSSYYTPSYKRKILNTSYLSDKRNQFNLAPLKGDPKITESNESDDLSHQDRSISSSKPDNGETSNYQWRPSGNNSGYQWTQDRNRGNQFSNTTAGSSQTGPEDADDHMKNMNDSNTGSKDDGDIRGSMNPLASNFNASTVDRLYGRKAKEVQRMKIFDRGIKSGEYYSQGSRQSDMGFNAVDRNPPQTIVLSDDDDDLQQNEREKVQEKERIKQMLVDHANKSVAASQKTSGSLPNNNFVQNNKSSIPMSSHNMSSPARNKGMGDANKTIASGDAGNSAINKKNTSLFKKPPSTEPVSSHKTSVPGNRSYSDKADKSSGSAVDGLAKVVNSTANKVIPVYGKPPLKANSSSSAAMSPVSAKSTQSISDINKKKLTGNTAASAGINVNKQKSSNTTSTTNVVRSNIKSNNPAKLNLPTGIVAPLKVSNQGSMKSSSRVATGATSSTLDTITTENILKSALSKVKTFHNPSRPVNVASRNQLPFNSVNPVHTPINHPLINAMGPIINPLARPIVPGLNPLLLNAAARLNPALLLRQSHMLQSPALNQNSPLLMNQPLTQLVLPNNLQNIQNLLQSGLLQGRFR